MSWRYGSRNCSWRLSEKSSFLSGGDPAGRGGGSRRARPRARGGPPARPPPRSRASASRRVAEERRVRDHDASSMFMPSSWPWRASVPITVNGGRRDLPDALAQRVSRGTAGRPPRCRAPPRCARGPRRSSARNRPAAIEPAPVSRYWALVPMIWTPETSFSAARDRRRASSPSGRWRSRAARRARSPRARAGRGPCGCASPTTRRGPAR